jgi:cytochrome c oxidase subunit 2
MAISPPRDRLWWKQPIHRVELIWILVAFLWGIVMFGMMVYWHAFGKHNLSNETYRVTPAEYFAKTEAMVSKYTVREEKGIPVVHPPPGSDVYLLARVWAWYPSLEFEQGQTYRLHLSSIDLQHGFSLQPMNINIQVHPGYEHVLTVTADQAREYSIICNEFCGFGHHTMVGKLYVVAK